MTTDSLVLGLASHRANYFSLHAIIFTIYPFVLCVSSKYSRRSVRGMGDISVSSGHLNGLILDYRLGLVCRVSIPFFRKCLCVIVVVIRGGCVFLYYIENIMDVLIIHKGVNIHHHSIRPNCFRFLCFMSNLVKYDQTWNDPIFRQRGRIFIPSRKYPQLLTLQQTRKLNYH